MGTKLSLKREFSGGDIIVIFKILNSIFQCVNVFILKIRIHSIGSKLII